MAINLVDHYTTDNNSNWIYSIFVNNYPHLQSQCIVTPLVLRSRLAPRFRPK